MRQVELESRQGIHEWDLPVVQQVGALPGVERVPLLADDEHHVLCLPRVTKLIALALEGYLRSRLPTWFDGNLQNRLVRSLQRCRGALYLQFPGRAVVQVLQGAVQIEHRRSLPAMLSRRGGATAHVHAHAHRAHGHASHGKHATAEEPPNVLEGGLGEGAGALEGVLEEPSEDVVRVAAELVREAAVAGSAGAVEGRGFFGSGPTLQALLPELVVNPLLLRIAEHVVRLCDFPELFRGLFLPFPVLVRVPLQGRLPVRLLDVLLARILVDAQDGIVVLPHGCSGATTTAEMGKRRFWRWMYLRCEGRPS
mmetsp:Transcript_93943/g.245081  ORF Transcript_93943/g.245081 Transcript_93943/m.245081 type:complete len:310 (+) Transcript_93943:209-1138(+)